jgi:hypothetical protein
MGGSQFSEVAGQGLADHVGEDRQRNGEPAALEDLLQRRQTDAAGDGFPRSIHRQVERPRRVLRGAGRPTSAEVVGENVPEALVKLQVALLLPFGVGDFHHSSGHC